MKRNWSKKALSLLMAGTMMAGLAGCGSDAAQNERRGIHRAEQCRTEHGCEYQRQPAASRYSGYHHGCIVR